MNPLQMAQQVKHEIEQVAWSGGSAADVFGSSSGAVVVFAGFPSEEQLPNVLPCALIRVEGAQADIDHPELLTQRYTVITVVDVPGDAMGEYALLGGAVSEVGISAMRGAMEIDERIRNAVQSLLGVDGAPIMVSSSSINPPTPLGDGRHLVTSELQLECLCTSALFYQEPQQLANSGSTWTWDNSPASRYDFIQYRFGFIVGATPASAPSGLNLVQYTGTAATFDHTPVSGRVYQVFADYGRRGGSTVVGTSDALVGTYVTT